MKPKGLLIAVALLAALGAGVYFSNKSQAAKEKEPSKDAAATPKLLEIPDDQFQQITIKKLTGEVIALKRDNGKWRMTQPKDLAADNDTVGSMTSSLGSLTADKVVEEKATDLKQFGLNDPTLDVTINRKDGKTDHLLVGDDTLTGSGAYATVAGTNKVVTISSFAKTSLDKHPEDLRDKRVLSFDSDKLTRVELAAKGAPVEFGKSAQNEWAILKPRPLRADGGSVDGLITKLKDAKMDTTETDAAKKFAGATKVATATVTDASGTQTIEIRRDKDKNVFAKSSTADGIYKVNADLADAVDKGVDDFRNKKLFDFGFSDPSKVDVKGASYTKDGDKWKANGKVMDNSTVQTLIDKLRDLTATEFATTLPSGAPEFEATVTSNSGKRVEKVTITKQAERHFAQREGEPSIYVLDAKSVEDLTKAANDIKEAKPEPAKK
ncbi:MAG TPA: DUF4340 domain-containing protein [Candidatus Solibacter sp.]|nr:DUF4340 domain-containing protein [Candidatus Solibacter sp.]